MNSPSDSQAIDLFLPDFCSIRIVFGVVVTAELLAFVLALAGTRSSFNVLDNLALTSLFIQWVALSCAAVLCVSRRYLCRLQETTAAAVSYLSLIAVTGIVSEVAWWLLAGSDDTAWGGSHAVFLLRNLGIRLGFRSSMTPNDIRSTLEIPREDHANILKTMQEDDA